MPKPKILVVEDEFLIRLTLAEALSDEGFDVIEAETGDEGLLLLQGHGDFRLLLTDIQLPGKLDGLALSREARARFPDIAVIYMTGRPDPLAASARTARDVFITKPYLPSEVCTTARRLIGL